MLLINVLYNTLDLAVFFSGLIAKYVGGLYRLYINIRITVFFYPVPYNQFHFLICVFLLFL